MTVTFHGVIAPVLTPFAEDLSPDPARFVAHARWLLAAGCTALAPFGTTSEANSLSSAERRALLEALIEGGVDPALVIPGTGCCSLGETVELTRHVVALGCAGAMTLPPFYYKAVDDEGLFRYFAALVERVADDRLRLCLYHIPPVAQVGFSPALVARLMQAFPSIFVALKDSSGDWQTTAAFLEQCPGLAVFPGAEIFLLQGLRAGAVGCITATANVNPGPIRALYDGWQGTDAEARQAAIAATRKAIQATPMIPTLKHLVAHYRGDPGWRRTRPPLLDLAAAVGRTVVERLEREHGFALAA